MSKAFFQSLSRKFPPDRVLSDPVSLLTYACDAYPIQVHPPGAVFFPRSTGEVQRAVQLCREAGIPFFGRGSGTCLSGGASPEETPCLLIELARMRDILRVDYDDRRARVQAGLINLRLSEHTAERGYYFAPDPSSQKASTLGGNVAENAGGPHCFKYGMTTDHVLGMTLVTPGGEVLELASDDGPDLCGLATGSEGTFGIMTEFELRLSRSPSSVETWLASYGSMQAACRSVAEIVGTGLVPAALEILDRLTIQAVEASAYAAGYPRDAEAVLLVELDGSDARVSAESLLLSELLKKSSPLTLEHTRDPAQRLRLWKGRKGAFGAMGRLRPNLFVLDGVVPPSKLVDTLNGIVAICEKHEITLSNVFHAGDGNLHPNLSFDGRDAEETARAMQAGREILQLCVDMGGSITGEHGVGVEKRDCMSFMFDDDDLALFRDIKHAFDPEGLANPGKLLPTGGACGEVHSARRPDLLLGEDA